MTKELSEVIEVSNYQQKSTIKILTKVALERQKIETTVQGASQKTEALESLQKKKSIV